MELKVISKEDSNRRWSIVFCVFLIFCTWAFFWFRPDQWSFRRELPWEAKDIHESKWSEAMPSDYSYRLKARITEEQFQKYVAKFELTPHYSAREYTESSAQFLRLENSPGTWWDPTDSLAGTYVWQKSSTWIFAKYERGYLYLSSIDH